MESLLRIIDYGIWFGYVARLSQWSGAGGGGDLNHERFLPVFATPLVEHPVKPPLAKI